MSQPIATILTTIPVWDAGGVWVAGAMDMVVGMVAIVVVVEMGAELITAIVVVVQPTTETDQRPILHIVEELEASHIMVEATTLSLAQRLVVDPIADLSTDNF